MPLSIGDPNRPNPPVGSSGPAMDVPPQGAATEASSRSRCEPFRETIQRKLEQGLSAQRIWQDLRDEHAFADGYQSVQRYVRHLRRAHPLPFRRIECELGQQAQVDFGTGAPSILPEGQPLPFGVKTHRRRTHVFRMVLSHSRKAYSEVVYRQTTEQFIRCLENAFWHFGGVPRTLVIDNLKAAVTRADWFDPELTPKLQSFCTQYRTVNRPLEDWGKLIGDVPSATAILDRFLQHAGIVTITGKSYRLRNRGNSDGTDQKPKSPRKTKNNDCPRDGHEV